MKKIIAFFAFACIVFGPLSVFGFTVVIKQGDDFWKLSRKHHVSWVQLQEANRGNLRFKGNFDLIFPEQRMIIPDKELTQVEKPVTVIKPVKHIQPTAKAPVVIQLSSAEFGVEPNVQHLEQAKISVDEKKSNYFSGFETRADQLKWLLASVLFSAVVFVPTKELMRPNHRRRVKRRKLLDVFARRKKFVFLCRCKQKQLFALVAADGRFVHCAKSENKKGLEEIAGLFVQVCGIDEVKNLKYTVPPEFRNEYDCISEEEFSLFKIIARFQWFALSYS